MARAGIRRTGSARDERRHGQPVDLEGMPPADNGGLMVEVEYKRRLLAWGEHRDEVLAQLDDELDALVAYGRAGGWSWDRIARPLDLTGEGLRLRAARRAERAGRTV